MKNTSSTTEAAAQVHVMKRPITLISTKHIDFENLTAFESVTLSLALMLAVTAGHLSTLGVAGIMA